MKPPKWRFSLRTAIAEGVDQQLFLRFEGTEYQAELLVRQFSELMSRTLNGITQISVQSLTDPKQSFIVRPNDNKRVLVVHKYDGLQRRVERRLPKPPSDGGPTDSGQSDSRTVGRKNKTRSSGSPSDA